MRQRSLQDAWGARSVRGVQGLRWTRPLCASRGALDAACWWMLVLCNWQRMNNRGCCKPAARGLRVGTVNVPLQNGSLLRSAGSLGTWLMVYADVHRCRTVVQVCLQAVAKCCVIYTLICMFHCTEAWALTGRVGLYRHTSSYITQAGWQNCLVQQFLQCLPDPVRFLLKRAVLLATALRCSAVHAACDPRATLLF